MEESSFLNPAAAVRAAKIQEGMQVADFGAGSGFFTRAAARAVEAEGRVWAVDVHRELLSRIKSLATAENLHNVEVVRGDIEVEGGSSLPPAAFDFCIIANVLFSAGHKQAVAAEARRILKKHGRALVIDWCASFGGLGPHQDQVITAREAKKIFEDAGFVFVEDVPAGEYHWGFVMRKQVQ